MYLICIHQPASEYQTLSCFALERPNFGCKQTFVILIYIMNRTTRDSDLPVATISLTFHSIIYKISIYIV